MFPYAETHYKFRLPWSPLHKRWPEIFTDAPHQVLPGKPFSAYLIVKDADLYPVVVRALNLRLVDDHGGSVEQNFDLDWRPGENLAYRIFDLPLDSLRGSLRLFSRITVENAKGKTVTLPGHNFPGIDASPLEVLKLEHPLPYPTGWQAGEMHCHSDYSSDPVEFGAPLELMQRTADAAGLDFVLCTDHSYDFYYRRERYLERCDAAANFAAYRAEALALNARNPGLPTLVPGEEVSCGNSRGENVHLLTFGHPEFLPGLGDGGRRGFDNRPDLTVAETLARLNGTPSFAAHPKARIGWLERKIFRRGEWREEDLSPSPRGLQFWNGDLGRDYHEGKAFWIRQLLAGKRLLPIGANDAHGDFNRNVGVKFPLVSLKQGRDHVFGRTRTVVPCPTREIDSLRAAFLGDRCLATDGPFLEIAVEGGNFRVTAACNADFGALQTVSVYGAGSGAKEERLLASWDSIEAMNLAERNPLPFSSGYVRAEATTRKGRRALTSAVFLTA